MDKFKKDKIRNINNIHAHMYYELKHIEHLLFRKHPRSLRAIINNTTKIYRATVHMKAMAMQIEVIKQTPKPKYPYGGVCGIVDERGPEMFTGCNGDFINPIKAVKVDMRTMKIVDIIRH